MLKHNGFTVLLCVIAVFFQFKEIECADVALGAACTVGGDPCINHGVCDSLVCKLDVGGNCSSPNENNCKAGTVCNATLCAVVTTTTTTTTITTTAPVTTPAPVGLNGNCSSAACSTGFVCDKTSVTCKRPLYQQCSSAGDCQTGTDCQTNNCTVTVGGASGACKADSTCTDSNSKCTDKKCTCNSGYEVDPTNYTCIKSGSAAVVASILLIMASFVTSRLA